MIESCLAREVMLDASRVSGAAARAAAQASFSWWKSNRGSDSRKRCVGERIVIQIDQHCSSALSIITARASRNCGGWSRA